jgi:hypothetical protein
MHIVVISGVQYSHPLLLAAVHNTFSQHFAPASVFTPFNMHNALLPMTKVITNVRPFGHKKYIELQVYVSPNLSEQLACHNCKSGDTVKLPAYPRNEFEVQDHS